MVKTRVGKSGNLIVSIRTPHGKEVEVTVSNNIVLHKQEEVKPTLRFSFEGEYDNPGME